MKQRIFFLILATALLCISAIDVLDHYTESQVKRIAKNFSNSYWDDIPGLYALLRCNLYVQTNGYSPEENEPDHFLPQSYSEDESYLKYKENWLRGMVNTPALMHLALKKYGNVFMETLVCGSLQNNSLAMLNKRLENYNQSVAMYERLLPLLLRLDEPTLNMFVQNYRGSNDAEKQLEKWLVVNGFMTGEHASTYWTEGDIGALLSLAQRMGSCYYVPPKKFFAECSKFLAGAKPLIPQKVSVEKNGERIFLLNY